MQGLTYSASVNGRDDATVCTHPVTNDSADKPGKAPLVLGYSPFLPGFVGSLRDLRFYDRLVSDDEVDPLADPRTNSELVSIPAHKRSAKESATVRLAFLESDELPSELCALRHSQRLACEKVDVAIRESPTHYTQNPSWHPQAKSFDLWIEDITKPGMAGRTAWIRLMRRIYGSVDRWAEVYGIPINSWEQIE